MASAGDASTASSPSAQYSLTLRVEIDHRPGMLGKVASAIGEAGGTIGAVDLVAVEGPHTIRDITVETGDAADWPRLTDAVNGVPGALNTFVESRDRVELDGKPLSLQQLTYVLLNKPKGCITAVSDDRGRPTVMDYLPNTPVPVSMTNVI